MRIRDNRNASMELLPEEIKDAEEEIVRLALAQLKHRFELRETNTTEKLVHKA